MNFSLTLDISRNEKHKGDTRGSLSKKLIVIPRLCLRRSLRLPTSGVCRSKDKRKFGKFGGAEGKREENRPSRVRNYRRRKRGEGEGSVIGNCDRHLNRRQETFPSSFPACQLPSRLGPRNHAIDTIRAARISRSPLGCNSACRLEHRPTQIAISLSLSLFPRNIDAFGIDTRRLSKFARSFDATIFLTPRIARQIEVPWKLGAKKRLNEMDFQMENGKLRGEGKIER